MATHRVARVAVFLEARFSQIVIFLTSPAVHWTFQRRLHQHIGTVTPNNKKNLGEYKQYEEVLQAKVKHDNR